MTRPILAHPSLYSEHYVYKGKLPGIYGPLQQGLVMSQFRSLTGSIFGWKFTTVTSLQLTGVLPKAPPTRLFNVG